MVIHPEGILCLASPHSNVIRREECWGRKDFLAPVWIWPSGRLGSTCLPSYYFWSWDWWDHLPFPSPGLSKQRLNQSHLHHSSIPLLTLFPCFPVISQRQPCRQEWDTKENPQPALGWARAVPWDSAVSVDSLGGGPRQHHHLASCTPLDSLEKWNCMLSPISREVWTMWLWFTNVTVSGNKRLLLWSKIVNHCQM